MPFLIPIAIGAAGALGGAAINRSGQKKAQKTLQTQADRENAIKQEILNLIKPFATQLLQIGINPADIVKSPLGQQLLSPGRQAITGEFEQSRTNLIDQLASQGISGGLAAGPLANLSTQEALAQSNLLASMPQLAIQLGTQGANLLNQQSAQFNPNALVSQLAAQQGQQSPFAGALASIGLMIQNQLQNQRNTSAGYTPTSAQYPILPGGSQIPGMTPPNIGSPTFPQLPPWMNPPLPMVTPPR